MFAQKHYWPFVKGNILTSVDCSHKGPWIQGFNVFLLVQLNRLMHTQSSCRQLWPRCSRDVTVLIVFNVSVFVSGINVDCKGQADVQFMIHAGNQIKHRHNHKTYVDKSTDLLAKRELGSLRFITWGIRALLINSVFRYPYDLWCLWVTFC